MLKEESNAGVLRPVKAGTLNQLCMRLTHAKEPDMKFVHTFITTYQSFTTPEHLLGKLIQRYNVPVPQNKDSNELAQWAKVSTILPHCQGTRLPIQVRVYNVLRIWVDKRFPDFNPGLLFLLNVFIRDFLSEDGHGRLAQQLVSLIRRQESRLLTSALAPELLNPTPAAEVDRKYFMDLKVEDIASQLSLIEYELFRRIQPIELLNCAWNSAKLKHRSPHVLALINRFNLLSQFVVRMILEEPRVKQRSVVFTRWLKVCKNLERLNNFNAMLSILSGLSNAAVHRLRFTQDLVPSKLMSEMETMLLLLSSAKSYNNYRTRIHAVNPPLMPYLGVYLTDLTFIEDGNPDGLKNEAGTHSLINFKKRDLVYDVIREISQYQQVPYTLQPDEDIQRFLRGLTPHGLSEGALFDISQKLEPRGAAKSDIQ